MAIHSNMRNVSYQIQASLTQNSMPWSNLSSNSSLSDLFSHKWPLTTELSDISQI